VTIQWSEIRRRAGNPRVLVAVYVPPLLVVVATGIVSVVKNVPASKFTRDPAVLLGTHPLVGMMSNVGILLWAGAAAVCLFTALVLNMKKESPAHRGFLAGAGLFTLWLLCDDLFLFHEWLFPTVLGVSDKVLFLAYGCLTAVFLFRFRRYILHSTPWLVLGLALAFFAISMGLDRLPEDMFVWDPLYLLEDGAKLLGIVGWLWYFGTVCAGLLAGAPEASPKRWTAPADNAAGFDHGRP